MSKRGYFFIIAISLALLAGAIFLRKNDAWHAIVWGPKYQGQNYSQNNLDTDLASADHFLGMGIYEPDGNFSDTPDIFSVQHLFIDWQNYTQKELSETFALAQKEDRWPLVTIEPFSDDQDLLDRIAEGNYDQDILSVCRDLGDSNQPLFVRIMHEMDHQPNADRYPWVGADGVAYVAAYQHFVDLCRTEISEAYYVWSPVGSESMNTFYPGDDYVDYVGLSLYAFSDWEKDAYGDPLTFDELFEDKYKRAAIHQKPIMLAEFAVAQPADDQVRFFQSMSQSLNAYPLLDLIVYFHAIEPYPAGWNLPADTIIDWRIGDPGLLRQIKNTQTIPN